MASSEQKMTHEPIAIIGMSCRFPGGVVSPNDFWELLKNGVDAIVEIPDDRWDKDALFSQDRGKPGRTYIKWGGFLNNIDQFDPEFFGISPREAAHIDPQQRLLLEVAYESLEHAGLPLEPLRGSRTGVFVGLFIHDYAHIQLFDRDRIDAYTGTGTSMSIAANRISYLYDLRGPSVALDTACSSSLVALHQACESLRTGACDMVLAGGVNAILRPEMTIAMSKASMLSPDGRCHSFDAAANGYVRAEGAGMVVLKRLADAERDCDLIHAIIKSTASNQDGRTKGISVPNGEAQEALVREAHALAGIAPSDIQYVEAHGTGTPVGDPIEANALGAVLHVGRDPETPCLIGSVKSNIGHTESASGIAGLLKVVLALKHAQIPQNLHFTEANPSIDLDSLCLRVPTELTPWPDTSGRPRLACLNSFGFGGTNAHAVLQEAPTRVQDEASLDDGLYLVPLSAHSEQALAEAAQRLRDFCVQEKGGASLREIAYTQGVRRTHHAERIAIAARSKDELVEHLDAYMTGEKRLGIAQKEKVVHRPEQPAFLFTGMGPQWWAMGRELLEEEPIFRSAVEEVDRLFQRHATWSILEELTRSEDESRIQETRFAQPGIFAVQVGLFRLWSSWGVRPGAIAGHSVGEAAAAHAAGILKLKDAVAVVFHRSRLQHRAEGAGKMLAVGVSETRARQLISGNEHLVAIAALNSPTSISLAGDENVLVGIEETLRKEGLFARFLQVPVPYHSPAMNPLERELKESLQGIEPQKALIPYYSTIRGCIMNGDDLGPDYWWSNVRDTVLFRAAMDLLIRDQFDTFVEIGPHPVLARSVTECLGEHPGISIPSLRRNSPERVGMQASLGALYCLGFPVAWTAKNQPPSELPSYPWQRQRYWDESKECEARRRGVSQQALRVEAGARHPLLGSQLSLVKPTFSNELTELSYVKDHGVRDAVVYPGAAYLEMAIAAANCLKGHATCLLENVRFESALSWPTDGSVELQTIVENGNLEIFSREESSKSWTRHMTTVVKDLRTSLLPTLPFDRSSLLARLPEVLDGSLVYPLFQDIGLNYGPAFQGIAKVWRGDGEILAQVETPSSVASDLDEHNFHPAVLDACLHSLFCTMTIDGEDADMRGDVYLPVRIEKFTYYRKPEGTLYTHCRLLSRQLDQSFVGDIFIYNEAGELVASAERLKCQNLNRSDAILPEKLGRWLYEYRWDEAPLTRDEVSDIAEGSAEEPQTWLVYFDERGAGERVAELLRRKNHQVIGVYPATEFTVLGQNTFRLDLAQPEHAEELFSHLGANSEIDGVAYLAGLDAPHAQTVSPQTIKGTHKLVYGGPLHLVQALLARGGKPPRVWLISSGVEAVVEDDQKLRPVAAPLWGLARVIGNEQPELRCTAVDLAGDFAPAELDALVDEMLSSSLEDEIAFRGTRRYVHRFVRVDYSEPVSQTERQRNHRYGLELEKRGSFDGMRWRELTSQLLGTTEIEIEVKAVGLNFKDVMKASGLLPASVMENNFWQRALGMECSGVITRIGVGVTEFSVGDPVVAFAHHAFRSHVTTDACLACRKPARLSFDEAATIPLAFVTAYYALHHEGNLRPDHNVLIHAASGGVGHAAVMLAQRTGATIFATAGSEEKREYVRNSGACFVTDSRSLEFADAILEHTGGRGVDLILNSLAGEAIDRNLDILADYGSFLELGKVDIDRNHRIGMRILDRNASLHGIDLDRLLAQKPEEAGRMLREIMGLFELGQLQPLPLRTFGINECSDAFRHMAAAAHIGKVVITFNEEPEEIAQAGDISLDASATYLITGGFGGFGLELLRWLAEHGARNVAVLSRSGPKSPQAVEAVASLSVQGVRIVSKILDVGDAAAVGAAIAEVRANLPILKGVFHAAAILEDDLLRNQTLEKYEHVAASKLEGAWALHEHTLDVPLDHFVLFSSVTSVLGNHGSANYVAANCFVDSLAHFRKSQGLPALAINWGLIANVGMAQEEPEIRRHLEANGLVALHTRLGLQVMGLLLQRGGAQVTVAPINWDRWLKFHQKTGSPRFSEMSGAVTTAVSSSNSKLNEEFVKQLVAAEAAVRSDIASEAIRARVARVFGAAPQKIDTQREFTALGLDSLMALELRSRLEELGVTISVSNLLEGSTVDSLVPLVVAAHIRDTEQATSGESDAEPTPGRLSTNPKSGKWIVTPRPHENPALRLICFPYAGGAPTAFHDWSDELPETFEVSSINLPGRARRINEPARGSIYDMAREITAELLPLLDRPFAFFGHCMGSIIMFEVAQLLQEEHQKSPVHLFAGGSMAPHLYQSSLVYNQPDEKFMDVLKLLDFTNTRAMLEDEEMKALLMPTLRADFEAVVNYSRDYRQRKPLSCPITGFAAKRDLFAAPSSMVFWKNYTSSTCELSMLDVHHYFVETHKTFLTKHIGARLTGDLGLPEASEQQKAYLPMRSMGEQVPLEEPAFKRSDLGEDLDASDWLKLYPARGNARLRIYCMPSSLDRHPGVALLQTQAAHHAEICLVRTPAWEGKSPSILAQAHALARVLLHHASDQPFAFFGHCSGAILMYEVARCLRRMGGAGPVHLFASSAGAPHLYVMPNAYLLGDDKLVDVLDVIGHPLTARLRQEPELRRQLIPRFRADFEMMATHYHRSEERLDCPITVLRAKNDLWTFYYGTEGWKEHTSGPFDLITSEEGDHFHVERTPQLAGTVIARALGWGRSSHVRRQDGKPELSLRSGRAVVGEG